MDITDLKNGHVIPKFWVLENLYHLFLVRNHIVCPKMAQVTISRYAELMILNFSEWTEVERSTFINLDLETQELQIKTDSELDTNEIITVDLYAGTSYESYFSIEFKETVKFAIGYCSIANQYVAADEWLDFDSEPTSEINKIWRITEKSDHSELYIYCNDELVLTYVYADSPHENCVDYTGQPDITAIKFYYKADNLFTDTASDFYRVVGNNLSDTASVFYRVVGNNLSDTASVFYRVVGNNLSDTASDFYRVVGNNLSDTASVFYRVVGNNLSDTASVFCRVVGNNLSDTLSVFYRAVGNNLSDTASVFYRVVGNNLSDTASVFYRVVGNNLSDTASVFYRVVGNNLSDTASVFYRVVGNNLSDTASVFYRVVGNDLSGFVL